MESVKQASFSELVFSDLRRYRHGQATWMSVAGCCLVQPGLIASIILRAQQRLHWSGRARLARILRTVGVLTVGADFTPGMVIGAGLYIPHPVGITMGNQIVIGDNVIIAQGVTIGARQPDATGTQGWPIIGDGAILSARSTILGDVRVGANALVGANSTVIKDVDDDTVVMGVPARYVSMRRGGAERDA